MVRAGQYVVFTYDVDSRTPRDLEGGQFIAGPGEADPAAVAVCDSRKEAELLAFEVTERHPDLYCEIYDHEGKGKDPVASIFHPSGLAKHRGPIYARRQALIGAGFLTLGTTLASVDFHYHMKFIWGYILGLKCLVLGGTFMVRAFCEWFESRNEVALVRETSELTSAGQLPWGRR